MQAPSAYMEHEDKETCRTNDDDGDSERQSKSDSLLEEPSPKSTLKFSSPDGRSDPEKSSGPGKSWRGKPSLLYPWSRSTGPGVLLELEAASLDEGLYTPLSLNDPLPRCSDETQ